MHLGSLDAGLVHAAAVDVRAEIELLLLAELPRR